jgi:hypothetical protein
MGTNASYFKTMKGIADEKKYQISNDDSFNSNNY